MKTFTRNKAQHYELAAALIASAFKGVGKALHLKIE